MAKTKPKDYDRWDGRVGIVVTKRPKRKATVKTPQRSGKNAKK